MRLSGCCLTRGGSSACVDVRMAGTWGRRGRGDVGTWRYIYGRFAGGAAGPAVRGTMTGQKGHGHDPQDSSGERMTVPMGLGERRGSCPLHSEPRPFRLNALPFLGVRLFHRRPPAGAPRGALDAQTHIHRPQACSASWTAGP
uniref:Uncharacterized protein n=1 Tax=Pipistrellus kuhlii TaxID=59472 RepID=A0A7J7QU87_PIPKU|nr:hypothetical protein mPipKuh1_008541 [Pipistrellus kuhlii]